jgi:hypothetical protein
VWLSPQFSSVLVQRNSTTARQHIPRWVVEPERFNPVYPSFCEIADARNRANPA